MRKVYRVEGHVYVLAENEEDAQEWIRSMSNRFFDIADEFTEIKSIDDVIAKGEEAELDFDTLFSAKEDEMQYPLRYFLSTEFQLTEIIET